MGATEQRWAAQLACFDYEIQYRSGQNNKNADALSLQYLHSGSLISLKQPFFLPYYSASDKCSLQWADPDIRAVLILLRQERLPSSSTCQVLSTSVLALLRHWDCLVERNGVLHRQTLRPNGGEKVFQVVLPASLKRDVLSQLHQDYGHQGLEQMTELVCQHCFWPGTTPEVKRWC